MSLSGQLSRSKIACLRGHLIDVGPRFIALRLNIKSMIRVLEPRNASRTVFVAAITNTLNLSPLQRSAGPAGGSLAYAVPATPPDVTEGWAPRYFQSPRRRG